jgi:hypothetical protein
MVGPQHVLTEMQETVMHVMRWRGRGDTIDKGFCHATAL